MFKGKFSKISRSICNILIEVSNIYNIWPKPTVSNGLVVVKLKQDLKYRDRAYFEPVCPYVIYQTLTYLEGHNKFYKDISIKKGLSSEDMFNFSDIIEIQGQTERNTENISDGTQMTKNVNDARSNKNICLSWRSP